MKSIIALGLAAGLFSSSAAYAQNAKPSYEGSPETYKVIFEDQNFRVIEAIWKAGTTDKPHTHPIPSVIYNVTGCAMKFRGADGQVREISSKPGTANAVPVITKPHTAENLGSTECRGIIVEKK